MDLDNQPNFAVIADKFQRISLEYEKLANMQQGNGDILAAIRDLKTDMNIRLTDMDTRLADMDSRMTNMNADLTDINTRLTKINIRMTDRIQGISDRLDEGIDEMRRRQSASDANNIARLMNSKVHSLRPDAKLYPLQSLRTNTPIENFPETADAILSLPNVELNRILGELCLPMASDDCKLKQQRLCLAIGV